MNLEFLLFDSSKPCVILNFGPFRSISYRFRDSMQGQVGYLLTLVIVVMYTINVLKVFSLIDDTLSRLIQIMHAMCIPA